MAPPLTTPDPAPRFWPLFAAALGIRLAVVLLGTWTAASNPDARPPEGFVAESYAAIDPISARPVGAWYRADALWVVRIATHGYAGTTGPDGQTGAAFMPMLPAVLALGGGLGLNVLWLGVLVPNLAAAAGLAVFGRLAARLTNDRATGIRAFVLLNAFPTAFYFSAPYHEAFGLLFTALALSAWLDRKPVRAGAFAGVGCLARMTGATLGLAALLAWLIEKPRTRAGLRRAIILAAGCAVGVLAFLAVMWWNFGDPLAGIKSHAAWGRRSASPGNVWVAFATAFDPASPQWYPMAFVLLVSAGGIVAWVRRGAFWGLVALLPALQLASTGTFMSGHRVILAALPGFIELAALLRNRLAFVAVVAYFLSQQFLLLKLYVTWRFAG